MPRVYIPGVSIKLVVPGSGNSPETVTQTGGAVKDGEAFTVLYTPGGLTNATGININGIPCTSFQSINDNTVEAVAPFNDLLHDEIYEMVIY